MSYNKFTDTSVGFSKNNPGGNQVNKKGEATRQTIKENAYLLFAEKGFKEVTMKDICEATGLSRGGLYCHYTGTGQIFSEIIHDLMSRQDQDFQTKLNSGISAVTILDEVLNRYQIEMTDSAACLSVAIFEYFSMQEHGSKENSIYEQYLLSSEMWQSLIQYGIGRKEFYPADVRAVIDLLLFSYQGVRMYSCLMPVDETIPAHILGEIRKILVIPKEV